LAAAWATEMVKEKVTEWAMVSVEVAALRFAKAPAAVF
jgi:hypothetical protein